MIVPLGGIQSVDPKEFCDIYPSFSHCREEAIFDIHSIHLVINVEICETMVKPSS